MRQPIYFFLRTSSSLDYSMFWDPLTTGYFQQFKNGLEGVVGAVWLGSG